MCAWETNGGGIGERGVSRVRGRSGRCARRFEPRGRSGGAKNFFDRATDRSPRRPTAHVAVFFPAARRLLATAVRRAAARGNKPQVGAWRRRCGRDRPPGAVGVRARGSPRGRDVFLVARRARDRRGGVATRRGGRAERRGQGSPSDATGRGSGASGGRIRARDPEAIRDPARRTRRGDGTAGRPRRRARGRGAPRAARTGSARRARGGRGRGTFASSPRAKNPGADRAKRGCGFGVVRRADRAAATLATNPARALSDRRRREGRGAHQSVHRARVVSAVRGAERKSPRRAIGRGGRQRRSLR